MAKLPHTVIGVHITDRLKEAVEVQKLLTAFGRYIKTRLGLHEVDEKSSAPNGLVLLEMVGPADKVTELVEKINAIEGVEAKTLIFEHK